jgi:uncharacterized protein YhfF
MADVEEFWRRFVAATGVDGPYTAWGFGSSPEQATELGLLVRDGPKRATASRGSDYGPEEPMPVPGAWTEGEGDRSLAYWREAHIRFFTSFGGTVDEATPIVLERFELLWDGRG